MNDLANRLLLKKLLALDAVTCAVMGLMLVSVSAPIAALTAIPEPMLFAAGVLLLPIAAFMAMVARDMVSPTWAVHVIVGGNILWILLSVGLPISEVVSPNTLGWLFVVVQAAAVALFAGLEWSARHRAAPVVGSE